MLWWNILDPIFFPKTKKWKNTRAWLNSAAGTHVLQPWSWKGKQWTLWICLVMDPMVLTNKWSWLIVQMVPIEQMVMVDGSTYNSALLWVFWSTVDYVLATVMMLPVVATWNLLIAATYCRWLLIIVACGCWKWKMWLLILGLVEYGELWSILNVWITGSTILHNITIFKCSQLICFAILKWNMSSSMAIYLSGCLIPC